MKVLRVPSNVRSIQINSQSITLLHLQGRKRKIRCKFLKIFFPLPREAQFNFLPFSFLHSSFATCRNACVFVIQIHAPLFTICCDKLLDKNIYVITKDNNIMYRNRLRGHDRCTRLRRKMSKYFSRNAVPIASITRFFVIQKFISFSLFACLQIRKIVSF